MKKRDISVLQGQLMKYLHGYYDQKGFSFNREENAFELNHVKIFINVETENGPYYTIRPHLTVIYEDMLEKISSVIAEYSSSNFLKIQYNSHFYVDNHLAALFYCKEFDECEENSFNRDSSIFEYKISNPVHVLETLSRHKIFMESVGFRTIEMCNNLGSYYEFLKKVVANSLEEYENYFAKRTTVVNNRIQACDVYTLSALGKLRDLESVTRLVSRYEDVLGETHLDQIAIAKLILERIVE